MTLRTHCKQWGTHRYYPGTWYTKLSGDMVYTLDCDGWRPQTRLGAFFLIPKQVWECHPVIESEDPPGTRTTPVYKQLNPQYPSVFVWPNSGACRFHRKILVEGSAYHYLVALETGSKPSVFL